ncbi:histidine kinase [Salinimicrobium marinum]|uniref:Histidine kinase n=1 Tax=Salinimicrobium marinum TaxID=680283 RepID=A0A918VYU9_9FLAO|nr:alpha/beta hydrolase-fold protein [Salinimicrobium marinum]GHA35746.1 histidine kinase [Salinimicrobium marinum]
MIKKLLLMVIFLISGFIYSQTQYKRINSSKLKQEREIKIQLPRNYDENTEKIYPVIIVLDGDYLFEPMAGNVDYYSYWDEIPEAIVVGVNQAQTRVMDSFYDNQTFLPSDTGANFFEFLGMELLPYIDSNYRTSRFSVLAGHDLTANFINYYLFKDEPLFKAYINLSPELAPEMENWLVESLNTAQSKKWFYLATATNDEPSLKEGSELLDQQLKMIDNANLHYKFEVFQNATHYSLVAQALPKALESIFSPYRPINQKDYDTEIVNSGISPYDYLIDKYETIENNYGLELPVRLNDFLAIGKALEFNQRWYDLEKLGELAIDHLPDTMLGTYYLARSYEESGRSKKAMRTYQNAYGQQEIAFITTDFMLKKAEKIKEDFGY